MPRQSMTRAVGDEFGANPEPPLHGEAAGGVT